MYFGVGRMDADDWVNLSSKGYRGRFYGQGHEEECRVRQNKINRENKEHTKQ